MNEVPLIQEVRKNDINTSIIAIKKQLKQLIEAVGLIESPNAPDLSPYVKKADVTDVVEVGNSNPVTSNGVAIAIEESIAENIVDVVEDGNAHAVTSNAVANSLSYSTEEVKTGGVWVDGKTIYRKTVTFGALPNNTTKTVAHGISNIDTMIDFYGIADDGTYFIPIPRVGISAIDPVDIFCTRTDIYITTKYDATAYVKNYVTLEYTKTTS